MITSCDTTGRALHPPAPPIMNDDSNNDNNVNVFWKIMAFFESYADLQVKFLLQVGCPPCELSMC